MKRLMIACIRWYQRTISPKRPPTCRFLPTCSEYAVTAIGRFGALRGGLLAFWRILRCNPWGGMGYDPVPERYTFRRVRPVAGEEEDSGEDES